jgi:hypothetical protein
MHEPSTERYGLRLGEGNTITAVASNLAAFADELGVSEDQACKQWADGVAGLEHAPGLDPVVGVVPGIGPALFAYLRMRSGSDALKPDLRVARGLRQLGFRYLETRMMSSSLRTPPQLKLGSGCWCSTSFSGGSTD